MERVPQARCDMGTHHRKPELFSHGPHLPPHGLATLTFLTQDLIPPGALVRSDYATPHFSPLVCGERSHPQMVGFKLFHAAPVLPAQLPNTMWFEELMDLLIMHDLRHHRADPRTKRQACLEKYAVLYAWLQNVKPTRVPYEWLSMMRMHSGHTCTA
jgi:hypothetical protein